MKLGVGEGEESGIPKGAGSSIREGLGPGIRDGMESEDTGLKMGPERSSPGVCYTGCRVRHTTAAKVSGSRSCSLWLLTLQTGGLRG